MGGRRDTASVVVFDGSEKAYEDLRRASAIAEEPFGTLEITVVANLHCWGLAFGLAGGWDTLTLEDEALEELERDLAAAIAEMPRRVDVRSQVVRGGSSHFRRRRRGQSISALIASIKAA
jgi:hypothetical protein